VRATILTTGLVHHMKGRPDLANTDKSKCHVLLCVNDCRAYASTQDF